MGGYARPGTDYQPIEDIRALERQARAAKEPMETSRLLGAAQTGWTNLKQVQQDLAERGFIDPPLSGVFPNAPTAPLVTPGFQSQAILRSEHGVEGLVLNDW